MSVENCKETRRMERMVGGSRWLMILRAISGICRGVRVVSSILDLCCKLLIFCTFRACSCGSTVVVVCLSRVIAQPAATASEPRASAL